MNILEEIAEKRKEDVAKRKTQCPIEWMKRQAYQLAEMERAGTAGCADMARHVNVADSRSGFGFPFKQALSGEGIHFICEVKKASPSKGIIAENFPYPDIAREYEQAGASAISVLTEPEYFLGRDEYLREIATQVLIPVLRKDFTVDAYQIYEAKVLGASAVLLICALLNDKELREFLETAHSIGLSALVEAHDEEEVKRALAAGAEIIGVNNRDLKTFAVDIQNSVRLRKLVPENVIFVSESGIRTADDIKVLKENGTNAVLIGETLMRSADKTRVLSELAGEDCR